MAAKPSRKCYICVDEPDRFILNEHSHSLARDTFLGVSIDILSEVGCLLITLRRRSRFP